MQPTISLPPQLSGDYSVFSKYGHMVLHKVLIGRETQGPMIYVGNRGDNMRLTNW
ncbi:hypothetical protein HYC85_006658 [Camellia sinensis]|uniref:Uncharacterized protein n=1 Tax=Camellia sinensis TaxID=4442 RepID=A0A7J7HLP1_CAMSI|nr:hypothetical protein HYC85_006658 [Camellia sinensis]